MTKSWVIEMIVTKVKLHNWQGYFGTSEFDFDGESNLTSSFIYADNTMGKSAFWEAFHFALYGKVERRNRPGQYKPYIAENSGDYPLLNVDQYGKIGAHLYVEVFFKHDGDDYRLYRSLIPRFENREITKPNDLKFDVSLENLSKMGSERNIQNEDRWIKENILPERLAKFFLFDGERLEEYEDLMTKDQDIDLRRDIEDILRTPILTEGFETLKRTEARFRTQFGKAKVEIDKNQEKAKRFDKIKQEMDKLKKSREKLLEEKKKWQKELDEIDQWLLDNDKTKEAAINLTNIKENIERSSKAEEEYRKDIIHEMRDAWKIIISPMVDDSLEKLHSEKKGQEGHLMEMGSISESIKHLKHEHEGHPCESCKRPRDKPTDNRIKKIKQEISELEHKYEVHQKESKYPTPAEFHLREMSLTSLQIDEKKLKRLFDKENNLMVELKNLKKLNRDKEKQLEHISEEKNNLVKQKLTEQKKIKDKMEQNTVDEGRLKQTIEGYQEELKEFTSTSKKGEKEPGKIKRLRKTVDISESLKEVFQGSLKEFREGMRAKVEARASETFLRISNNRENYDGLRITGDYAVSIMNKKGKTDAGSQAQSLVMAYSIIEALSSCSGFEFPMVIDTPGRGLAKSNVSSVYDFFIESDRQVIFLPNDLELNPDEGDERYGGKVSATYELIKVEEDRTKVLLRHNSNLR